MKIIALDFPFDKYFVTNIIAVGLSAKDRAFVKKIIAVGLSIKD